MFLFVALLSAILYYQMRLVKRLSLLEQSQNNQNENSSKSPNPAVAAAIIAAVNLHKSKQR
jgi:Na+-transporting methylmalonyl-CoA/oxaloacetate decarboxylase gamma subunit